MLRAGLGQDGSGAIMMERDEIAQRYGFESFAELLDISEPLPMLAGETVQAYVAKHSSGQWFIWDDMPAAESHEY